MPKTLLILDDHEQIAAFVKRVAEDLGYDAIATTTVALFEESFYASPPDEIILDLKLGRDDGIEVLRFLAARQSRARVTLMSGTDGRMLDTARQLAVGLGLNVGRALPKPMRAAALKAALAAQQEGPAPVTPADLAAGIANGEVRLVYQPVITCATGALVGFEALARWWRPTIGCVFPDSFIPLAEADPDLMDRLTFSLPARLAEDLPLLDACGFEGRVALNISAQNLRRLDFPERFDAALRQHGLKPDRVKLEVTETAAMSDPLVQIDVLLRLCLKGFELSIDDFGTGYSSLSMLRRLPYSELKIDRSFVKNIGTSHDSLAIVKAVLALAQSMSLVTVAEGVEDDATLTSITDLGATRVQGFGIGRPMPASQVANWVRSRAETDAVAARRARYIGTDAKQWS